MALPESFLEELRARISLAALVGRHVRLVRAGRDLKGLCPFHAEKTPSFHVVEDKGFFHCFGCGAHGDAIAFVMRCENLGFREAVEKLAAEAGLSMPRPGPEAAAAARTHALHAVAEAAAAAFARRLFLPEGRAALEYLRRRGLAEETIRLFGLGWSGEGRGTIAAELARQGVRVEELVAIGLMKQEEGRPPVDLFFHRVMFPIRDRRGRVIGFGGRLLGEGQPKYLNGPETALFAKRRALYGIDRAAAAVRAGAELVVVEGYLDVIALHQAGFGGAVAPLGTALTADHLAELWRLAPAPVLCFDGDAAGARAVLRAAETALPLLGPGRNLAVASLPAGEDPDTLLQRHGPAAFRAVLEARRGLADALFDAIATPVGATPEARADQRRRLEELAGRIADRVLREEYRRHFRDRWFGLRLGRGTPRRAAPRPPPPPLDAGRIRRLRERDLLALLLTHPHLLPRFEETLAAERFLCPICERVRAALIGLDPEGLLAHLRDLGLAEALEAILGRGATGIPPATLAAATPAEAAAAVEEVLGRLRLDRLDLDLEAARTAFAADPSAANQRRLEALQRLRAALLAGAEPTP